MAGRILAKMTIVEGKDGSKKLEGLLLAECRPGVRLTLRKVTDKTYHLMGDSGKSRSAPRGEPTSFAIIESDES